MAKKHELATLSKANRDLALLIDEDLQKESELLQKLIKEVYEANQKVKEGHLRRVEETNEKLDALNREIDALKKDIDTRETSTTEQFQHLLDARDDIHAALRSLRLFDARYLRDHPLATHLAMLKNRIKAFFVTERQSDIDIGDAIIEPLKTHTLAWVEQLFDTTEEVFATRLDGEQALPTLIKRHNETFTSFQSSLECLTKGLTIIDNERTHFYYTSTDDDFFSEKIDRMYERAVGKLEQRIAESESTRDEKLTRIDAELETLESDTLGGFKQKYQKRLEAEEKLRNSLQDDLKQLRFDIMTAEKQGDEKKLASLLKTYDRKEKQNLSLYEEKVKRLAKQKTKRQRDKLQAQRKLIERKHEDELYKLKLQRETEKLKFKESTALFKVREDHKALEGDRKVNARFIDELKGFHQGLSDYKKTLVRFAESLQKLVLAEHGDFALGELKALEQLTGLKKAFKTLELDLAERLKKKADDEDRFVLTLQKALDETAENIHFSERHKALLEKQNREVKRADIDRIRAQEDAKNDRIYYEGQVEIAEKEYELQLLKIRSLYQGEIDITKSQAERLNVGMGVNEAMVRTTVESQRLFAEQQIKFAHKEYDARVENIERARAQELEYAQQKLAKAEQPYLYERKALLEERDEKLETIEYRLALFVEEEDKEALEAQKARLLDHYGERLNELDEAKANDAHIIRYKKQIAAAEQRAENATKDAEGLKQKTVETFESLLKQSEEKLQLFERREDSKLIPYIESESTSTAKTRLNEALAEAKAQRDEKVAEPQQRIADIDARLQELEADTAIDHASLEADKNTLAKEHHEAMQAIETRYREAFDDLDKKTKETEHSFGEAREKLTNEESSMSVETLKSALLKELKATKTSLEGTTKKQLLDIQADLKNALNELDDERVKLEKNIQPTIRAFKRYLKTVTRAQDPKLKPIQKRLEDEHKANVAAIDSRY